MFNNALTIPPVLQETPQDEASSIAQARSSFLQLQTLVTLVLSYQLLFSEHPLLTGEAQMGALLGLMLICGSLIVLPAGVVGASWFPGLLALGDTAITTGLIYLSGEASSDLYLTYFVIILIATTTRTPKQMFALLSVVCAIYGMLLYREVRLTGVLLEHHLLRVPLLLIMAIFYSRTVESVRNLSQYDSLTGLPNRLQFRRLVSKGLAHTGYAKHQIAILSLDLDGFKLINDTLGYRVGDQLLKGVAARLKQCLEKSHTLARHGGDEFIILLEDASSSEQVARLAKEIIGTIAPAFRLADREIFITTSIGIALYPQDAGDADSLIKNADAAMSRAKQQGKNVYQFYSADMNTIAYERLELENSFRKALAREEIVSYYQPQVELATGRIVGLEALARWKHPDLGLVSPTQFISIAEETGLIVPLGDWMLRKTCTQVNAWHDGALPTVKLTVNLSARQLKQPNLVEMVSQTLQETGLNPKYLELELTESILMQDTELNSGTLRELKSLGIRLSIDDFGTGYSSLSYLKRFPIDTLKIDQTFIRDITTSHDAEVIVTAIIAMARALKLKVIAEGVENEAQLALLGELGCHEAQGFVHSQPLPAAEMEELMRKWPSRHEHTAFPTPRLQ
ncbi:MAG: putative bifunctional diguanylate cyclase/phosphodiesterase [Nitrospiraceae bacterium]